MQKNYYIDLFAGCGGLSLGLYNAGWTGLFAVEKNSDAFSTLEYNLIKHVNHFEWPEWLPMTNLDINELLLNYKSQLMSLSGKVALVVGGPPCQGFSMAGKRNRHDVRNTLSESYIEFIKLVKPEVLFLENVHGFTVGFEMNGEKEKPYSDYVINELEKLGYKIKSKMIDVSEFGVPQRRKRFILVGMLDIDPGVFFERLYKGKDNFLISKSIEPKISVKNAIGDLLKIYGIRETPDFKSFLSGVYGEAQSSYQKLMRRNGNFDPEIVVNCHRFAKHKAKTIEIFEKIMEVSDECKRIAPKDNLVKGLKKRGVTPLKANAICPTITSIPDDFVHYIEPRVLTVREMARIQSFPDWYEFKGKYTTGGERRKIEVPRFTQVANAVSPLFAEQVGITLKEMLKNE